MEDFLIPGAVSVGDIEEKYNALLQAYLTDDLVVSWSSEGTSVTHRFSNKEELGEMLLQCKHFLQRYNPSRFGYPIKTTSIRLL
jgi:hypothetical protein